MYTVKAKDACSFILFFQKADRNVACEFHVSGVVPLPCARRLLLKCVPIGRSRILCYCSHWKKKVPLDWFIC
uniref:Uncharacterized protein n=1 Tax=Arundo donax TaxID=35708 RepID=A0A0A9B4V6_ARUDO